MNWEKRFEELSLTVTGALLRIALLRKLSLNYIRYGLLLTSLTLDFEHFTISWVLLGYVSLFCL